MSSTDRGKLGQVSTDFTTLGERWRRLAVSIMRKRTPGQTLLRFSEKVRENYASPGTEGNVIDKGVQPTKSKAGWLPDVALEMRPLQAYSPDQEYVAPKPAGRERDRINPDLRELETVIERGSHLTLDSRLQEFLVGILHMRIPAVKIYANQASDAFVKQFRADAVAYEDNILFRAGKYDPQDKAGIALLGHELTHAALARMQHQSMPGYGMLYGHEAEERQALNNEKRVLHHLSSPQMHGGRQESSSPERMGRDPGVSQPRQAQTSSPKAALTSRDLTLPPEKRSNADTAPQLSNQQLKFIKEEVYRDLMHKIRIEFERGG